jgi:hypothetical protein
MSVKRFVVAIPAIDGGVELHPMKEWLRKNPDAVPSGLDATESTPKYRSLFVIDEANARVRYHLNR